MLVAVLYNLLYNTEQQYIFQETLWPIYFVVILVVIKITAFPTKIYPEIVNTVPANVFAYVPNGAAIYYYPNSSDATR